MVSPNHMHGSYASRFFYRVKEPPHPSAYSKTRWVGASDASTGDRRLVLSVFTMFGNHVLPAFFSLQ